MLPGGEGGGMRMDADILIVGGGSAGSVLAGRLSARGDRRVNAKSIMGVMMLAAEYGAMITLRASGPDAEEALESLAALVAARFGEN